MLLKEAGNLPVAIVRPSIGKFCRYANTQQQKLISLPLYSCCLL